MFAGRERERDRAWGDRAFGTWAALSFLSHVTGYGIGYGPFRVLWGVVSLTLLGAIVLWFSPYARSRGVFWRLGASLHRLLPIVELNKEFKDFFETRPGDGELRPRLNRFQTAFFSVVALAGWVLSFFLLAAMSGLSPK
jgi:hypothetical protein